MLAHDNDQSMKRNRFSEERIIGIFNEHEAGVSIADLSRNHCVGNASIYASTNGKPSRQDGGLGGQEL